MKKYATMNQWNEIGEATKQARQQLMNLGKKMRGKTKIKYQDRLVGIIARLDKLRSDLEEEMFQQHPDEAHINVFFGKNLLQDKGANHDNKGFGRSRN